MSLDDSFGVIGLDCKHGVNNRSSDLLTSTINSLFTVGGVGHKKKPEPNPIADFALTRAEKKFGSIAAFSVALFGSDKRQQVGQWRFRGIPANQEFNVSQKLD